MKSEKTWVMGSEIGLRFWSHAMSKNDSMHVSMLLGVWGYVSDGRIQIWVWWTASMWFWSVYGEPSWEDSGMYRCEGTHMWMQHFMCQRRMFTRLMLHMCIPVLISTAESMVTCSNSSAANWQTASAATPQATRTLPPTWLPARPHRGEIKTL